MFTIRPLLCDSCCHHSSVDSISLYRLSRQQINQQYNETAVVSRLHNLMCIDLGCGWHDRGIVRL
ncbi:hypothetical protein DAPPUDRAFT_241720 [Daphnia pulex]|uniref:Uncharacterized protein n=1 Tax=Daphnia pulex TaxID=6669 RepID=E9GEX4_DAPPU|nr:hypothetical protein DAPPUDRAFT_241720 [Daphnia pulex]|eukprot:EFX81913.1 hypothetical protein DAPPUDRAFT_241720 [Daphnia pulex]